jgi:hypothetical protein
MKNFMFQRCSERQKDYEVNNCHNKSIVSEEEDFDIENFK